MQVGKQILPGKMANFAIFPGKICLPTCSWSFAIIAKIGTGIPSRWPIFPTGSFLGKISASYLGKNLTEKYVLAGIQPSKTISSRIPSRILPGRKILIVFPAGTKFSPRKNSYIDIPAEKLHILEAKNPSQGALSLILRFDPGGECRY